MATKPMTTNLPPVPPTAGDVPLRLPIQMDPRVPLVVPLPSRR